MYETDSACILLDSEAGNALFLVCSFLVYIGKNLKNVDFPIPINSIAPKSVTI